MISIKSIGRIWPLLLIVLVFSACKSDPKPVAKPKPKKRAVVPKFERDSAYVYVDKQVAFGPRVPNTEAHRKCKDWLAASLRNFGAKVIEQDFVATAYTGVKLQSTNIIGSYNPDHPRRILLAAHWDS